jgi:hypothetical protein
MEKRSDDMSRKLATAAKPASTRTNIEPKSVGKPAAMHDPPQRPIVSEGEIRVRAYSKWVAAGRPQGDGVAFWLEAERELRGEK